jgi:hypothetical protein
MRLLGLGALLLATACSSSAKPPPPQPIPKRIDWPSEARVFRGKELEEMRARWQLAGVTYGTGCYCMPTYVVRGDDPEGTNLRGEKCADVSLAPGDSPTCFGVDPSGIEQEGRYLCLEFRLGPRSGGASGAADLK